MPLPADLRLAYEKTLYVVKKSPPILLRIGQTSAELADLLREHDSDSAFLITSDNPYSDIRSDTENAFHRDRLQQIVVQTQLPFYQTISIDPSGQWPEEHGFLVLDLAQTEAFAWLGLFDQWAGVWADKNGTTTLLTSPVDSSSEPD